MNGTKFYLFSVIILRIFEREFSYSAWGFLGDEFNWLHYAVYDLVLNSRVFTFGVFSDGYHVDIIVQCFITF